MKADVHSAQLNDAIYDAYKREFNEKPSPETLTHLRRELIHAVWRLLLDGEFMDAYENGIVIMFPDGIERRVFPCFSLIRPIIQKSEYTACIGCKPC